MRVALVHDWLTGLRGGEKCLQAFLRIYPDADVYTLIHLPGATDPVIDSRVKRPSFLQNFPGVGRYYRLLLPLYPAAINNLKLDGYDLIISTSHAAAKNVPVSEGTFHISYCFTPMRYIWDQAEAYLGSTMSKVAWPLISSLRAWDREGADRVDHFVAISRFVAARIKKFYDRRASVIFPPVETSWITSQEIEPQRDGQAFLCAGALVPYKRPELALKVCNELDLPLWVVGGGPLEKKLRAIGGKRVKFFGRVSDAGLAHAYRRCRGLIFPGEEDFGMVPVECMAAGRPIIALGRGGALETVNGEFHFAGLPSDQQVTGATGVFAQAGTGDDLKSFKAALEYFISKEGSWSAEDCTKQAECFTPEQFYINWNQLLGTLGFPLADLDRIIEGDVKTEAAAV